MKRPATVGEKTCKAPAVIVADPGQAVNPDSKFREELTMCGAICENGAIAFTSFTCRFMRGHVIWNLVYTSLRRSGEKEIR